MGIIDIILIINIVLKLIGLINWSWWIVLWPLWVSIIFAIIMALFLS